MMAARTPDCRLIAFDDPSLKFDGSVSLRKQIAKFVVGVRRERKNPVSEKQIVAWFKSTKPEFVKQRITDAVASGEIAIVMCSLSSNRRHNGAYRYEAA